MKVPISRARRGPLVPRICIRREGRDYPRPRSSRSSPRGWARGRQPRAARTTATIADPGHDSTEQPASGLPGVRLARRRSQPLAVVAACRRKPAFPGQHRAHARWATCKNPPSIWDSHFCKSSPAFDYVALGDFGRFLANFQPWMSAPSRTSYSGNTSYQT